LIINAKKDFDKWQKLINFFKNINLFDIYYDYNFNLLHLSENNDLIAFYHKRGKSQFFFPFIICKIDFLDGYYDIETINGYSGPLSNDYSDKFLKECWSNFYKEIKNLNVICGLIRFHPFLKNHLINKENNFISTQNVKKTLFINYNEDYKLNYSKNINRNLIKSSKYKLEIIKENNESNFKTFYEIYNESMNRKDADKRFFFKKDYFTNLLKKLNDNVTLILAKKDTICVGGIIGIRSKNFSHVHLSAFKEVGLKYGAPYLLRYELIEHFSNISNLIHFGGGNTNAKDDSLFLFKKNFTNKVLDFFIGKILIDKDKYELVIEKWINTYPKKKIIYNTLFMKYKY
tara:strand:+ start:7452 stop:8486 length:1035 start_codon:yes stop_codon:yes gene_type:complete